MSDYRRIRNDVVCTHHHTILSGAKRCPIGSDFGRLEKGGPGRFDDFFGEDGVYDWHTDRWFPIDGSADDIDW